MAYSSGAHAISTGSDTAVAHDSPLCRARTISGLISEEALASERLGRLTDKVAAALMDANLCSIRLPQADGGLGGTGEDLFEAAEEIARADGSAGWCMAICNAVNTFVHKGVPAGGPTERCSETGPAACWATVAAQGYFRRGARRLLRLGQLQLWIQQFLFTLGDGPRAAGRSRREAVVSRSSPPQGRRRYQGRHWDAMGLRGTASIDYAIADKFVPAHRTFEYPFLAGENPRNPSAQGLVYDGQPGLVAFASGIGFRALSELLAAAPKTKRLLAEGMQADDNVVQFGIGELEGRLRAARTHYLELVAKLRRSDCRRARARPGPIALDLHQAAQTLTRAARDMTVFAFDNAGTTVVMATNPLQRCLRDIFTGLKHAILTPAILGRIGKVRLGLEFGAVGF